MGHIMTTADSACLFLKIKKNTKYRSVHLPILHGCVLQEKKNVKIAQNILCYSF